MVLAVCGTSKRVCAAGGQLGGEVALAYKSPDSRATTLMKYILFTCLLATIFAFIDLCGSGRRSQADHKGMT